MALIWLLWITKISAAAITITEANREEKNDALSGSINNDLKAGKGKATPYLRVNHG